LRRAWSPRWIAGPGPDYLPAEDAPMLFHVQIAIRIPPGADPQKISELSTREIALAKELQISGKWRHIWRIAGKWANISIFDVTDPDELHDILSSLPLYPYMEIEVMALCRHPASIAHDKGASS
jgi:muconolactone D-isomerase